MQNEQDSKTSPFDKDWRPDRGAFRDERGTFYTQGLFLEIGYDADTAVYTLQHDDREYNGKWYPSIRRLYLETSDPTEYKFARRFFYSWEHWQRIAASKVFAEHIASWRAELAVLLRARAVDSIIAQSATSFQAAKWLADNGIKPAQKTKQAGEKKPGSRVDENATNDRSRVESILRGRKTTGDE
jgi:hypothetical protein